MWPVYQHNDSVLCVTNWLARRSRLRNHCGFVSVIVSAKNLHEILPFFLSLLLYYSSCWENHDKWYYQLISWFWTFFVILASNLNFWSDLALTILNSTVEVDYQLCKINLTCTPQTFYNLTSIHMRFVPQNGTFSW